MNLKSINQNESFLLHINHASLLIKSGENYVLTDPWFISPAFASWVQNPSPPEELIEFICNIEPECLAILVSHGHDDHTDDFFLKTHLYKSAIYFSKFRSPGLENRMKRVFLKDPVAIDSKPVVWNDFTFSAAINAEFTNNDAINIIRTNNFVAIHANDNWHKQPNEVLDYIRNVKSEFEALPFYYFSQIGIADCFPSTYSGYSDKDKQEITSSRLDSVIDAAAYNSEALGIVNLYSYANQSWIDNSQEKLGIDNYKLTQNHIDNSKCKNLKIDQLNPGDYFLPDQEAYEKKQLDLQGESIFEVTLKRFESATNAFLKNTNINGVVKFAEISKSETPFSADVMYVTSRYNWQVMMTGAINLEAITIGGIGYIHKLNNQESIRDIHNGISKFAYIAQKNFIASGFQWFK